MNTILHGDALDVLRSLPDACVHCIVTSPPYFGLRDYGADGQIGLEPTPEAYVASLVAVFREARRVLRNDGTLWLNLGDSYAGSMKGMGADGRAYGGAKQRTNAGSIGIGRPDWSQNSLKPKDLIGIPWRVAFALQSDGWWLRSDIIWQKPNCMPESVRDRPTKSHEYVFLLTKSARYYYDADAVREASILPAGTAGRWKGNRDLRLPGGVTRFAKPNLGGSINGYRNRRDVWSVATSPYKGAHFAVMPPALVEPCVLAGCPTGGVVLDPFMGAGTVGVVAKRHSRHYLGIELNAEYIALAEARIHQESRAHLTPVKQRKAPPKASAKQQQMSLWEATA